MVLSGYKSLAYRAESVCGICFRTCLRRQQALSSHTGTVIEMSKAIRPVTFFVQC